jgi:hypothetical protein
MGYRQCLGRAPWAAKQYQVAGAIQKKFEKWHNLPSPALWHVHLDEHAKSYLRFESLAATGGTRAGESRSNQLGRKPEA